MGPGWLDGGDLHVLEILQAVAERRKGGETGIRYVEALRGEDAWTAHTAGSWESGAPLRGSGQPLRPSTAGGGQPLAGLETMRARAAARARETATYKRHMA